MLISVIIPSYQPKDYLWQCLDSLCAQSMPLAHFEVLLVLNGDIEPYRSQISSYISLHPLLNLNLIIADKPGVSHARNIGLSNAKGDFIAFIDDDDFVSPSYLSEMLAIIRNGSIPLSNIRSFIDSTGEEVTDYLNNSYNKNKNGVKSLWKASSHFAVPYLKLIPRDIALSRRFNERLTNGEDSLYMFAISHNFSNFKSTSPHAVYHRRIRQNSLNFNAPAKQLSQLPRAFCAYIAEWLRHPLAHNFIFFSSCILSIFRKAIEYTKKL